ncbi:hypothetical protein T10_11072 [Trichinella papuae]|uniref:Uncharacterized protein n=1 Tax=Trichinella papuae TaxID=268474 RepID=A0A0V1MHJ8_9BILA|nr:hypothetical protein T10_11072 [Trichinella papuae]
MSSGPAKSTPTFTNGGGAFSEDLFDRAPAPENPEPLPEGGVRLFHTCVQLPQVLTPDQQFSQPSSFRKQGWLFCFFIEMGSA